MIKGLINRSLYLRNLDNDCNANDRNNLNNNGRFLQITQAQKGKEDAGRLKQQRRYVF